LKIACLFSRRGNAVKLRNVMFYQLRETWRFSGLVAVFSRHKVSRTQRITKQSLNLTALPARNKTVIEPFYKLYTSLMNDDV
jgi:hypothetical protein